MKLSTAQYVEAIRHALSQRQLHVLRTLYCFPNATAKAKQLAEAINSGNPAPITANNAVGTAGRAIAKYHAVVPGKYNDGHRMTPAYFQVIGLYTEEGGWRMWPSLQRALVRTGVVREEERGSVLPLLLPTEEFITTEADLMEGRVLRVYVNTYERNIEARKKCLEYYGHACQACGFDFGKEYGKLGEGYIQVHHVVPLSEIKRAYKVNPITDLVPLCANCHCMIHNGERRMTVTQLRRTIMRARQ